LLLLFNGYYDFNKDNSFRPYITGGIGLLIWLCKDCDCTINKKNV
jgi:hypothetical protein